MLQRQLDAAARNEPIPRQPTPMKMLLPRQAPAHQRKNKHQSSKENVIPPRSLLNDIWATNLSSGTELGRVIRLTENESGRTVTTTKTAFSISDKNKVTAAGLDVSLGDTIQMS